MVCGVQQAPGVPPVWSHKKRVAEEQRQETANVYRLLLEQQQMSLGRLQRLQEEEEEK